MESLITFENVDFCCGMQKLLVSVLLSPFMGRQPGEWITGKPGYLMREFVICLYFSRYIYTVPLRWNDRTT